MVLVTGAAGHLGCALVRELVADGEKVRVLVLPKEDLAGLRGIPLDIVKGNVLDLDSLRRAAAGMEVVYHLAGIVSIMPGRDGLMRRVNVEGTANMARVARESGVRRMIYVSSIHALARPPEGTPIDERVRMILITRLESTTAPRRRHPLRCSPRLNGVLTPSLSAPRAS